MRKWWQRLRQAVQDWRRPRMGVVEGTVATAGRPLALTPGYAVVAIQVQHVDAIAAELRGVAGGTVLWCAVQAATPLSRQQVGEPVRLWAFPSYVDFYADPERRGFVGIWDGGNLWREIRYWQERGQGYNFWRALDQYAPRDAELDRAIGLGPQIAQFLIRLGEEGRFGDESLIWAAIACWRLQQEAEARALVGQGLARDSWGQMCFVSELFVMQSSLGRGQDLAGLRQLAFTVPAPRACGPCPQRGAPAEGQQWFCPPLATGTINQVECPLLAPLRGRGEGCQ